MYVVTPYEIGGFRWMLAFEPYVNPTNHTPLGKVASITAKKKKNRKKVDEIILLNLIFLKINKIIVGIEKNNT